MGRSKVRVQTEEVKAKSKVRSQIEKVKPQPDPVLLFNLTPDFEFLCASGVNTNYQE